MNPSPFGRILWKEARAQFSLWLALVIGALLLQVIVIASGRNAPMGSQGVTAVVFVLTCCFMVASIALLFTGETEDGTRDWLRQLPIRPGTLIGAKLSFTLVATLLYFVTISATAVLAIALDGRPVEQLLHSELLDELRIAKSYVGICIWG
ncbi:MAG: ABC transporter permease, partial [Planctomycetaceae bacterium]|nr:ABC transporter permease [Planctomycetaceae bacterium]